MKKAKRTATKKTGSRRGAKAATAAAVTPQSTHNGNEAKGSATKPTGKKRATTAEQGAEAAKPNAAREGSKKAQVLEVMRRPDGAGLKEIMEATGWQRHTVRGFMAGTLKKMNLRVDSYKREDGERAYRLPQ